MANAGRVLILAKGAWVNTTNYSNLDLVTKGNTAYLARQSSIGVDPSTDSTYTYWQPFGSSATIATTSTPGLVMPDGTTITVDNTGLIKAALGVNDLSNVSINTLSDGQVLKYNSSTLKWENVSLGSAASKSTTNAVTQGSTALVESGAVYTEISSLNSALTNKQDSTLASVVTIGGTSRTTVEGALGALADSAYLENGLTSSSTTKALTAAQGLALANKQKVSSFEVSTSSWSQDTTSQSGTTLQKKTIALSHCYVDSPSVDIGAASGSVLPTSAQQTAYNLLQYVTVDSAIPCLYLYASDVPTDAFYINVEGVD